MTKKTIAVIGESVISKNSRLYKSAFLLGKILVDNNFRIQHGGRKGVMEAVTAGARTSENYKEGMVIGILPGISTQGANKFLDICIPTGLDLMRNMLVVNADAVIAVGGKSGTLSEIAFAWLMKKMIIAYDISGWSAKLADTKLDNRKRIDYKGDKIFKVSDEKEVIKTLKKYLKYYSRKYKRMN